MPADGSWSLNPVVEVRRLFESLPTVVRRPIELVVFGGDLPRADVSGMRWMAAELRAKAAAMNGHAEDAKTLLTQEDSLGALGDRVREMLQLHHEGAARLREEALALADQAHAAANDAEKTLCVMFAFGVELAWRIIRTISAAAAAGPAGQLAAAPLVESMLIEGRGKVALMRAALEQAYKAGAAKTAARLSAMGPYRLALTVGTAAALPAGVDLGAQLMQVASGDRNSGVKGPNGENPRGIDLKSIEAAAVSGAGGALGGMAAGVLAPKVFPRLASSRAALGLVQGLAGAGTGLGAAALITGWPENFEDVLASLLSGGFAGVVDVHGRPQSNLGPSFGEVVDGSGAYVPPDPSTVSLSKDAVLGLAGAPESTKSLTPAPVNSNADSQLANSAALGHAMGAGASQLGGNPFASAPPGPTGAGRHEPDGAGAPARHLADAVSGERVSASDDHANGRTGADERPGQASVGAQDDPAADDAGDRERGGRGAQAGSAGQDGAGVHDGGAQAGGAGNAQTRDGALAGSGDGAQAGTGQAGGGAPGAGGGGNGLAGGGAGGGNGQTDGSAGAGGNGHAGEGVPGAQVGSGAASGAALAGAGGDPPDSESRQSADYGEDDAHAVGGVPSARAPGGDGAAGHEPAVTRPGQGKADPPVEAGNTPGRNGPGGEAPPRVTAPKHADLPPTHEPPGLENSKDGVPADARPSAPDGPGHTAEELAQQLAGLPSADPATKRDLTAEQQTQFKAASKKALALYRLRQEELAGESWEQRRHAMEHGDRAESLLRYIDAVREGTGKTPRWNQIEAFLLGEHGFMRQMGTGQGKSMVGALDTLWQLSRGEPVELVSGDSVRVHHVITTTEVLANEGVREFAPMLRGLGYEVARWDPHNPQGAPDRPTVYYMTYDERATAELFDRPPPGKTATIDEADAVLVHNQTVHYQSEGQRELASEAEAAGVYRVRDFLKAVLRSRITASDDLSVHLEQAMHDGPLTAQQAGAARTLSAEEVGAARTLTARSLREQPEQCLDTVSRLWESYAGRKFTAVEIEMARAFLDVKAGRLKLNRDFQIFGQDAEKKVQILDEYGKPRSDPKIGTESRWFGGRHKMVEAMFGAPVYSDGTGSKQVTVEDVLGGYEQLHLMSGTLERTAAEIKENFPVGGGLAKVEDFGRSKLVGEQDRIFLTEPEKLRDAVDRVRQLQAEGRPVLVICPFNDLARNFSLMLTKAGVEHNAIDARWFAEHRDNNAAEEHLLSVKDTAGVRGAVTVGTGMLGRGFDVSISDEVDQLGGVHAHMLGRSPTNPDEDHQWSARAGRNGRNGSYCFNVAASDRLYSEAQQHGARVAITHYRTAMAMHAEATAEYAEAGRLVDTDAARPAEGLQAARAKVAATAADVAAAEREMRSLTAPLQNDAADRAYLQRAMRRANQAHAPPTAEFPAALSPPVAFAASVPQTVPGTAHTAAEVGQAAEDTGRTSSDTVPAENRAATETVPAEFGAVQPHLSGDRFARLAGWLGIPASVQAAAAASDTDDDDDPLSRLLERAGVSSAAVQALNQHLDHAPPAAVLRADALTDEQALNQLMPRRNRLAAELGWEPGEVAAAEGVRQVGAAVDTSREELAALLDVPVTEVNAATARDVLADAVARVLTPAETADDTATELLVFAASTYLAVSALLDLAVAIHQRSPKSCVNNGVTMMRVLYPGNEHVYQMPADMPLRGHNTEDTERAFGGDFRTFMALDEAAESLKARPGGSQALVYKWMNKGEVESHLVLLVNDSDRADAPNLVVLDIAAAPGEAPITPADLAAPRALLRRAVPFQQWQREQQPYIEQLDEADRRVFAIEFDSTGQPLSPLPTARRPVFSAQDPGSSPPGPWSSRAPPLRRGQFALAGHRTPGADRTPDSVRAVTPPGIERESEAESRSGEDAVPTGSRPLADPGGRSGEDVAQRFAGVRSPDAEVLARHIDSVGVERFLVVKDAPGDGEPTLWRLPSAREAAALNVRATTRSHSTETGVAAVEAAERTGAAAGERQIADARWLTHGELDVRIVNRQVQGEFAQRFTSALESFDPAPAPADAAAAIARLGSRLSLSVDDIEQLTRRAAGRPAEEQERLVGYLSDLADEFEINDMTAEVYADLGDRDRLDNCLRTQRIRVALTTHPDIVDVISTPMSEVLLFEMVRSAHWTGATIGNALEFLVRPQVAAALREIHRNNPHFAPYVARRMSKSTAAELERVGRELDRIAEIPADVVDGRLLDGFGRYVSPIVVGDISRVIAGGSSSDDEVTSHDRAWDFLLDLEDFSPGWVRQKFADVFLAAGQIANLPEHVRSEVTFTAQRLREVEDIYLRGSQGGDFTLYVAKVGELPPSQRPPTIRTAMEFAREVTPEFARCLRDLLADDAQGAERQALGLRRTGDAGLRELHKIAGSFVNEVKSAVISAESLAKVQSSEFLARLLIDITRYDSSGWGGRGIASLRELLGNHDRAAAAGHIAPMPVEYRPSGVLEVAKLRTRDTDSGPGWTEDLLTRFARLSKNLQDARAALTGVPRPFTYLLGKLGHGIADRVEALERSIRSGTLADGSPMNDVARRNMMSRAQEMKELLAPTTESAQRFPALRSLRDFEHNFQRLARVGELHDDLRTICFAWAMRRHPEWVDRLENIRADEPTLEDVSLVRDFVEHITNQQVFAHYFENRKGANVFRRVTSTAALDEAILRTQGVGVSSDTTKLQFVPTRGPLLELSGHIASACWAGKYPSVAAAMPNMTAVIMVRNPDDPGRTALAGAGLLIETTSASGEPILLVRGLNPSETYINHVSVADFYREFTSWAQGIATARGRRLAIVIDGRAGDAATNRPVLFGHLVAERRKLTPVRLTPGDSEFNGYDVTRCAYLVQPDSAHDERERRTGPGGLIGSRPSSESEGAERTTAEAGTPESSGPTVVGELGRLLVEHGVVVGRAAAARVLGPDTPEDQHVIELSIPEWLYRQCEAEGWTPEDDQPSVLTRDRFRVSVGWPGVGTDRVSHEDLFDRSWQPAGGGSKVALPADVYAWTQETQDRASADLIKERLLSPAGPPLPAEVIEREIGEVTEILRARVPREQLADPEIRRGIRLAAEGLFANRTLYGHPDVGRANHLHDDAFELREFGVAALYHNGMGVAEDLGRIADNGVLQGADLHEIVWAMVADAWSDLVYGGGRRSDNPDGYDELRSARLLHDRALSHGCDPSIARMLGFAVNGTGFDERTGTQMIASPAAVAEMRQRWGKMTDGEFRTATRVARWVAAADLQTLSEPDAVVRAIELALEDLMSRRFDPARVFGRVLSEWGARVNDVDEALRLADWFGRVPPEGGHITVRQALLERLRGNATFTHPDSGYQPPDGWLPANRDMRRDHAAKLREIADRLASDSLYTPLDAYRDARSHAAEMREKYSGFRWQVVVGPGTHVSAPAVLAATIAARLPESDPSGMSRDVIEALPRITEFVSAQATSSRDTGNAPVIVVTSSQDADGRPRLVAQLDYTRPDATDSAPGVTREELRRELSDVDCRIDIETADALPEGQVWHSLRLDFTRQRILVCCGEWGTDSTGMATLNVALCRALAEAGHEVTVRAGEVGSAHRIPGVTVIGHRESGAFASMRERMLSDWDELPPSMDLVIVHDAASGLAAALAAEERYPAARLVRVNHLTPMLRETLGHDPERGGAPRGGAGE
ncbi:hypothetical protein [Nocardia asiatica]|uniref:preprotein translocase subunit SecA n=1 Tax=Nocardia asiatica TaxID=209252 RepID=UPI00245872F4|nr:hypothetical protein [Nocardia asiatica]